MKSRALIRLAFDPDLAVHQVDQAAGYRKAQSGPAEEPCFAAADKGGQKIDHFDAGLEDLALGHERVEGGHVGVDGPVTATSGQ